MKSYRLEGLDCANCAMKIEKRINEINGVKQANVNFAVGKLTIDADQDKIGEIETETRKVIKELEPEVEVKEIEEVTSTLNEEKKDLIRIVLSAIGLLGLFIWAPAEPIRFIGFLLVYLFIGFDVIKQTYKTGDDPAVKGLSDPPQLLGGRDRRADCIYQRAKAGCDLYG